MPPFAGPPSELLLTDGISYVELGEPNTHALTNPKSEFPRHVLPFHPRIPSLLSYRLW